MILGCHDGRLEILIPDACCPVPNGQEVLRIEGVAHKPIHRSMMPCNMHMYNATVCKKIVYTLDNHKVVVRQIRGHSPTCFVLNSLKQLDGAR